MIRVSKSRSHCLECKGKWKVKSVSSMSSHRGFKIKTSPDLFGQPLPQRPRAVAVTLNFISLLIHLFLSSPTSSSSSDPLTGESPLHVAVTLNNETVITQLLELGASLAVQDLKGKTPVMTACEYGHLQALECLAERGIDAAGKD